jgi:hypothetical protein
MKRITPNFRLLRALYGFAGLVFGAAVANAAVIYSNNFEGAEAAAVAAGAGPGGSATLYAYGNQGGWSNVTYGGTSNGYWWYSTKYSTTGGATALGRPDPLGPASPPFDTTGQGSTALHGLNASGFRYAYRTLATTFVPGNTYRFSISATTDNGQTGQGVYLYFFRGSAVPSSNFDADSSGGSGFFSDGTSSIVNTAGGTVTNVVAIPFDSTSDAGNWQTVSYDFTPDSSMAGENIGIAIYMRARTAVDNVVIEQFIPEPGTGAVITGSLGLFLARRRRSRPA